MKIKTSELSGAALDWAVEEAQGFGSVFLKFWNAGGDKRFVQCEVIRNNSTNWAAAGPIIEQIKGFLFKHWLVANREGQCQAEIHNRDGDWIAFGPTLLVAAMRCFVASKLGDEVDVPEELG